MNSITETVKLFTMKFVLEIIELYKMTTAIYLTYEMSSVIDGSRQARTGSQEQPESFRIPRATPIPIADIKVVFAIFWGPAIALMSPTSFLEGSSAFSCLEKSGHSLGRFR